MTLYQFNKLDELEQLEALWENGVVVAEREDEVNRYKLYQVASFYVEVEWHKKYNVRKGFYSFASRYFTNKVGPQMDTNERR